MFFFLVDIHRGDDVFLRDGAGHLIAMLGKPFDRLDMALDDLFVSADMQGGHRPEAAELLENGQVLVFVYLDADLQVAVHLKKLLQRFVVIGQDHRPFYPQIVLGYHLEQFKPSVYRHVAVFIVLLDPPGKQHLAGWDVLHLYLLRAPALPPRRQYGLPPGQTVEQGLSLLVLTVQRLDGLADLLQPRLDASGHCRRILSADDLPDLLQRNAQQL